MANVAPVTATVLSGTGARVVTVVAGEPVTAGQPVYLKAGDGLYWLAKNDTLEHAAARGYATSNAAGAGQPLSVQLRGRLFLGTATVAAGVVYGVSATAGASCPDADIGSGKYKTVLSVGVSTTTVDMGQGPLASGVALA